MSYRDPKRQREYQRLWAARRRRAAGKPIRKTSKKNKRKHKPKKTKPIRHGRYAYSKYGCRCRICKASNRDATRRQRLKKLGLPMHIPMTHVETVAEYLARGGTIEKIAEGVSANIDWEVWTKPMNARSKARAAFGSSDELTLPIEIV